MLRLTSRDFCASFRDFIHHPRRLDPFLKDKPAWNTLASAMDVVSDTEWSRAAQNSVEVAA